MLRFISALAFLAVAITPSHAADVAGLNGSCSAQPNGTLVVDGNKASEAQMKAVRAEVEAYMNAAQDYISCVSLYSAADENKKTLSPADKQKLLKIISQVADEREEVGCGFQKQLDVYNKKHGLAGVDFDQVCLDRFAKEAPQPGAPKAP